MEISDEVTANLSRLIAKSGVAAYTALGAVADEILRLSSFEVPHDIGTLQGSGAVEPRADGGVDVGYNTPYAARLHEHPEYRFQKGRKGKYLEDPIKRNADVLGMIFGQNVSINLLGK